MSQGSTGYAVAYDPPEGRPQAKSKRMIMRLKTVQWTRVVVDTLLIAGILLASSSLLTVR